jgi:hypothetical protein
MKTYGGVEVFAPPIMNSTLDGSEWSASRPLPLNLLGISPRLQLNRRLGGPQNRPGRYEEERKLDSAGNRTPAVQPAAVRYTD